MQEQVQKQVQVPMEVVSQQMQELCLLMVPLDQRLMSPEEDPQCPLQELLVLCQKVELSEN